MQAKEFSLNSLLAVVHNEYPVQETHNLNIVAEGKNNVNNQPNSQFC